MDKKLLFTDLNTYQNFKKIEDELFKVVAKLQEIADSSLGINQITNYKNFLLNPAEYLVQTYWTLWGSNNYPPHADREHIFESSTRITIIRIDSLKQEYNELYKRLRKHAPKINAKGIVSGLQ